MPSRRTGVRGVAQRASGGSLRRDDALAAFRYLEKRPLRSHLGLRTQHAAADLVAFQGFEEGLEVALAEAFVGLPLDELEEHRPQQGLREDLQQQARSEEH